MRLQDLHTHSLYDDGTATLEQMIHAAMERGLSAIGLSGHSPIASEPGWTIREEELPAYMQKVAELQEAYRDKITVFRAIEYDSRSNMDLSDFDYVIGSIHATITPEGSFDADNTIDIAEAGINKYFAGDSDAAAKQYFSQYALLAENPEIDIIGHFDLVTKFNEIRPIYDSQSKVYLQAAADAMEMLVRAGKVFEVNTGAISRKYRTMPYPAEKLLHLLRELGGKVCFSSDAHFSGAVGYAFDRAFALVQNCGFCEVAFMTKQGFAAVPIREIEC